MLQLLHPAVAPINFNEVEVGFTIAERTNGYCQTGITGSTFGVCAWLRNQWCKATIRGIVWNRMEPAEWTPKENGREG